MYNFLFLCESTNFLPGLFCFWCQAVKLFFQSKIWFDLNLDFNLHSNFLYPFNFCCKIILKKFFTMILYITYLILQNLTLNLTLNFLFLFDSKNFLFGAFAVRLFLAIDLVNFFTVRYLTSIFRFSIFNSEVWIEFSNIFLCFSVSVISVRSRTKQWTEDFMGELRKSLLWFLRLNFWNSINVLFLITYHF